MTIEELISTYGYMAIGIGTFIEGETILVLGSFAAHRGYLELPWVILSAFIGTLFGDLLYFYMGRLQGKRTLEKRPLWKSKSERVLLWLDSQQIWLILGFRFLYGLRTVTPFIIGASNISAFRFLILSILGASIWSIVIGFLGYLFGNTLEVLIGDLKKYELLILALIACSGIFLWVIHLIKTNSAKKSVNRK